MPSSVASSISQRLTKMGLEVQRAERVAVERAAFAAKRTILAEVEHAVPGLRLKHVGSPPGAKVGVRYDVKGEQNPTALVRATGPLHLVENPIKPHTIIPKDIGRSQGRSKKARRAAKQQLYSALFGGEFSGQKPLTTPYGPRYRVKHTGVSRQPQPWKKGVQKALQPAAKELDRAFVGAFRRGATR